MVPKKQADKTNASEAGESAAIAYAHLEQLGDRAARREKYKRLTGVEAVRFYLMNKHHWTPSKVSSMRLSDLMFAADNP